MAALLLTTARYRETSARIPSICASRSSDHSNVKIQLPSFPFGCYTNPYTHPRSQFHVASTTNATSTIEIGDQYSSNSKACFRDCTKIRVKTATTSASVVMAWCSGYASHENTALDA